MMFPLSSLRVSIKFPALLFLITFDFVSMVKFKMLYHTLLSPFVVMIYQ